MTRVAIKRNTKVVKIHYYTMGGPDRLNRGAGLTTFEDLDKFHKWLEWQIESGYIVAIDQFKIGE